MITRVQFSNFNAYNQNAGNVSKSASASKVSNSISFKRGGNELYEETLSMIDDAKRKAEMAGVKELKGRHEDGAYVTFSPTKRGMDLSIQNKDNPVFNKKYGHGYRIETKNCWVTWTNQYASFELYEIPEGEFDAVIQKYLPVVM